MDAITETKSAAARFMADHERLESELATAKLTVEDQRKEIERLDAKISLQTEMIAQISADRNTYLQYGFELAAQLQFMVAGSSRALIIAQSIRNAIANKAAGIPPIEGADVKQLNNIIERLGEGNKTANDGAGMTNDDAPKPGPMTDTPQIGGTLVDRDGQPIIFVDATPAMKRAS